MKNLYRNKQKNIRLMEEFKIIEEKFKLNKCKNMEYFIRKYLLKKEILELEKIITYFLTQQITSIR